MKFDRTLFFKRYRKEFGNLSTLQVDGLNRLLWGFETYYGWWDHLPQIANALAQIKHETAHSFNPVVEGYYLGNDKTPGYFTGNTERVRRFQRSLRYYPHFGMGDIQLTWKENYEDQDLLIRKYFPEIVAEYNQNHEVEFDLVKHPEQALDGRISFCVMTIGMHKGTFREGHNLDRYINSEIVDHFNARSIVNGDKNYKNRQGERIGDVIAQDARRFETILKSALVESEPADGTEQLPDSYAPESIPEHLREENLPDDLNLEQTTSPEYDLQDSAQNPSDISAKPIPADNILSSVQDSEGITEMTYTQEARTESGTQSLAVKQEVAPGDPPEAPPKSFINLQDWKPFVTGKLRMVWRWFGAANIAQFPALSGLGGYVGGGRYWWIGIAAALLIFALLLLAAATVSGVLLLILFWNRIEQFTGRTLSHFSIMNPKTFNLGVKVEKKF